MHKTIALCLPEINIKDKDTTPYLIRWWHQGVLWSVPFFLEKFMWVKLWSDDEMNRLLNVETVGLFDF